MLGLVLVLAWLAAPGCPAPRPVFSRSHAQPDVDLARPPQLKLHHQANISVPSGDQSYKTTDNIS